jgi:hypothetical protein
MPGTYTQDLWKGLIPDRTLSGRFRRKEVWHRQNNYRRRLTACGPSEDLGPISDDTMDGKHHVENRRENSGPFGATTVRASKGNPEQAVRCSIALWSVGRGVMLPSQNL